MESSQVAGEEEECNSSESGWTKYIASPMQEDAYDDDDDNEDEGSVDGGDDDDGDGYGDGSSSSDSEDSMASDACSRPSHFDSCMRGFKRRKQEESDDEEDDDDMDDG